MKTITVRVPEELAAQIEAESRRRKVPKSDVVRERLSLAGTRRRRTSPPLASTTNSAPGPSPNGPDTASSANPLPRWQTSPDDQPLRSVLGSLLSHPHHTSPHIAIFIIGHASRQTSHRATPTVDPPTGYTVAAAITNGSKGVQPRRRTARKAQACGRRPAAPLALQADRKFPPAFRPRRARVSP